MRVLKTAWGLVAKREPPREPHDGKPAGAVGDVHGHRGARMRVVNRIRALDELDGMDARTLAGVEHRLRLVHRERAHSHTHRRPLSRILARS